MRAPRPISAIPADSFLFPLSISGRQNSNPSLSAASLYYPPTAPTQPRFYHYVYATSRSSLLSLFFLSFFRFYDEQWDLQWSPPEIASVFFTRTVTAYVLRTSLSVFFCLFFATFVSRVKLIRSVVQPAAWTNFNLICKVLVDSDLL